MLKRIDRADLRVGMFIEALEGGSLNLQFERRRFVLKSEPDLKALRNSNLSGAYINTARGLDLSGACPSKEVDARSKGAVDSVYESVQDARGRLEELFDTANAGGAVNFGIASDVVSNITASMEVDPTLMLGLTRIKTKDDATFLHSIAVSALMSHFARHLNMSSETAHILGVAGLLHDIGKTSLPYEVLTKPGALTPEEMEMMREHPSIGAAMLSREADMDPIILDVCCHHHERPDGKGYPFGIGCDQLSVHARIAAICDVYDAVTSKRPYKKAWTPAEAVKWMDGRVGQFDEALLYRFWISLAL